MLQNITVFIINKKKINKSPVSIGHLYQLETFEEKYV